MGLNKTTHLIIENIEENIFKDFFKTIPFRVTYNHFGYSYAPSTKRLVISITTKKSQCYKMVKSWLKVKHINHTEQGGVLDLV